MSPEIIYSNRRTLALQVKDGRLIVRAPYGTSGRKIARMLDEHRAWIEKTLQKAQNAPKMTDDPAEVAALIAKAKEVLPGKIEKYAAQMGLYPAKVSVGRAKTRFGCCSEKRRLTFSAYLMLYPDEAIDYVVVHELAHLKYMNHGKRFYALIARVLPDYKARIKLLKGGKTS